MLTVFLKQKEDNTIIKGSISCWVLSSIYFIEYPIASGARESDGTIPFEQLMHTGCRNGRHQYREIEALTALLHSSLSKNQ